MFAVFIRGGRLGQRARDKFLAGLASKQGFHAVGSRYSKDSAIAKRLSDLPGYNDQFIWIPGGAVSIFTSIMR